MTHSYASAQDNPIVSENQLPGTTAWNITNSADDENMQIKGFASLTSVNKGQSIDFHVHVSPPQPFTIDIYRLGWYNGQGGRLVQSIGPLSGTIQPAPTIDTSTGMVVAPWAPSYTLAVPSSWTSGIYLAKLINNNGFENYIVFVVRDDGRIADFLYQHAVTTSQSYNNFPDDGVVGKSFYNYNSYGGNTIAGSPRAVKISFDRPYAGTGSGDLFKWETYLVRWLEKEGYDVSYSTNIDLHTDGSRLLNYKGFISAGHDEYWTSEMYTAAENARDSGVNLMFTGSNAVFWQSRLESNNRVLVGYKDAAIDPISNPALKTIKFRDLGRAEQALIGVQYKGFNSTSNNTSYVVQNSAHWVYDNTGFTDGSTVPNITGYEVDSFDPNYPSPPANGTQTLLSNSPYVDYYGESVNAHASIYQASSGAWVFATGTMSWPWALDRNGYIDTRIQQMATNILTRFRDGSSSTNQPPTISNPGNQTTALGQSVSLQIIASDPDGDFLSYSATGLPAGLSIDSGSGLISGSPTVAGTFATTVRVSDGTDLVSVSFTWSVTNGNSGCGGLEQEAEDGILSGRFVAETDPNASGGAFIHVPDGTGNAGFGSPNQASFCFTVANAGDYIVSASVLAQNGASNSFFATVDGQPSGGYTWDLARSSSYINEELSDRNGADPVVLSLTAGEHTLIVYLREDGTRLDRLALESYGGSPVNNPPTVTNPGTQSDALGENISLQIVASDPDGDSLSYSATDLPAGLSIDSGSGLISGSPTVAGTFATTVRVNDGTDLVSVSFTWSVTNGNSGCGGLEQEAEDGILSGRFVAETDPNASDGAFIHVPDGTGNAGFGSPNQASFCFTVANAGDYIVSASVLAQNGASNSFFATVDGQPSGGYTWDLARSSSYVNEELSDRNGADPVILSLTAGEHTLIVYLREDGTRLDRLALESYGGSPVNNPPTVTNPGTQSHVLGENVSLQIVASDPDGDSLSYSATNLPAGLSIDSGNGLISGSPTVAGTFATTVRVNDGTDLVSVSFTWSVTNGNSGCGGLEQEAEDGVLSGRFVAETDPDASGGAFIYVPDGTGNAGFGSPNQASYCFTVVDAGEYLISAVGLASDGTSNSFFVTVNGAPSSGYFWALQLSSSYLPDYVNNQGGADPVIVTLPAGENNVTIHLREDGTRLDRIALEAVTAQVSSADLNLTGGNLSSIKDPPDFIFDIAESESMGPAVYLPFVSQFGNLEPSPRFAD